MAEQQVASTPQQKGKRVRSVNFTQSERLLFVEELMPKYRAFIECKKTDQLTAAEKDQKWCDLAADFNIQSPHFRTVKQLQSLWENLKKNARKNAATDKQGLLKTGGGDPPPPTCTPMDLKVLGILQVSGVGRGSRFDGDSEVGPEVVADSQVVYNEEDLANMPVVFDGHEDAVEETTRNLEGRLEVEVKRDPDWVKVCPRMMYFKKPAALKVGAPSTSSSPSSSSSAADPEALKCKTVQEESEWAQKAKRRRPSLPADDGMQKLITVKAELAAVMKERMEERSKREKEQQEMEEERVRKAEAREQALFEAEKVKKDLEAELLRLQVMKLRKDLGLPLD